MAYPTKRMTMGHTEPPRTIRRRDHFPPVQRISPVLDVHVYQMFFIQEVSNQRLRVQQRLQRCIQVASVS